MKIKTKSISILFFYISYFININTTIISEGYHFFDIFYNKDIYKSIIRQKKSNKCSIEDGPNCVFIEGKDKNQIIKDLKYIYPDEDIYLLSRNPRKYFIKIKRRNLKNKHKRKRINRHEVFSFDSPYVMSLYLTF